MSFRQVSITLEQKVLSNKWFQAACVSALVFVIYYVTSTGSTAYDHYVRLSDAFLHGRIYLTNAPPWLELARVGDKAFVIDPPAPVIFVLPWVAIWGLSTNQVIISMLVGSAAVGLFWVAVTQLRWSLSFKIAMTVLVAFGTNLWWVTTEGSVWMYAHASAVFFLMAALVETTGKNRPWLVGLLLGLAGLSRLPVFLVFPFFAYSVIRGTSGRWQIIRRLTVFGIALGIMAGAYLAYNYARYDSIFDQGVFNSQYAAEPWFSRGRFSLSYIPRNVNSILFTVPKFTEGFPFFKPSLAGLGLFFTTPALLYIFRAKLRGLTLAACVGTLATATIWMLHGTTGWVQFGYRYSLDALPLLALLVASGMRYRLDCLKIAVIVLSCSVNLWGVLAFHEFNWATW